MTCFWEWFNFTGGNLGNIFETSVFAELVKKYGLDKIKFWRNKNQNEIDFILEQRSGILPIEVKESFYNFRKSSINYFLKKYNVNNFRVIGIKGEKASSNCIFPWEV